MLVYKEQSRIAKLMRTAFQKSKRLAGGGGRWFNFKLMQRTFWNPFDYNSNWLSEWFERIGKKVSEKQVVVLIMQFDFFFFLTDNKVWQLKSV